MIRHIFAGGNTPEGFYSYFDQILPVQLSRKTIYLKGGSGTGKSTFMRKTGKAFEEKKYDVEYFHCSNDPDSLDGVYIPKLKAAIVDATAPHVQDPAMPAAVDEILNVAVCLNSKGLQPYTDELLSIMSEKKGLIHMAYSYLHAGYAAYKNNTYIYEKALDLGMLNETIQAILKDTFPSDKAAKYPGTNRKLFASAITPSGFVNYSKSLFKNKNMTVIKGIEGCGIHMLLERLKEAANVRGYQTEGFYSPLSPSHLEHLIIPELDCCFTTSNKYHKNKSSLAKTYDFYGLCNSAKLEQNQERIKYNTKLFDELTQKAMNYLQESSLLHRRVEEIYIANMDFDRLNRMYDKTMQQLLELEE